MNKHKSNTKYEKVHYMINPTAVAFAIIKQNGAELALDILTHMVGSVEAEARVVRANRVYGAKLRNRSIA
jgi:hypothetical protein